MRTSLRIPALKTQIIQRLKVTQSCSNEKQSTYLAQRIPECLLQGAREEPLSGHLSSDRLGEARMLNSGKHSNIYIIGGLRLHPEDST